MSVDLTCPMCKGTGCREFFGPGDHTATTVKCCYCTDGRRRPTLDEWDVLVAERDRLRETLKAHIQWQATS